MKQASQFAGTIVFPPSQGNIYYSRDLENWYPSQKETFTEEEWNNMQEQKFQEKMEIYSNKMYAKYEKELAEAYQEYYETGDINSCLQVHFEDIEYEKYLQKLEDQYRLSEEEEQLNKYPEDESSDYSDIN